MKFRKRLSPAVLDVADHPLCPISAIRLPARSRWPRPTAFPLVASFLVAMIQEHERGVGGWQAEWPILSSVIQATALALESVAEVVEGLSVDSKRMRANIENTQGRIFAERASMLLAQKLGKDAAFKALEEAARDSAKEKKRLAEVLAKMPEAAEQLGPRVLRDLEISEQYLGSA